MLPGYFRLMVPDLFEEVWVKLWQWQMLWKIAGRSVVWQISFKRRHSLLLWIALTVLLKVSWLCMWEPLSGVCILFHWSLCCHFVCVCVCYHFISATLVPRQESYIRVSIYDILLFKNKIYFRIILDLQCSCKDSRGNPPLPFTQLLLIQTSFTPLFVHFSKWTH